MRAIRAMYKDMLLSTSNYEETVQKLNGHKLQKKQMENAIKEQLGKEFDKYERLKFDLASDAMLISDLALSQYLKGQSVQVTDEKSAQYDPIFQVKFKKK